MKDKPINLPYNDANICLDGTVLLCFMKLYYQVDEYTCCELH